LIGGMHIPLPGEVSLAIMACSSWMNDQRSDDMSSQSCANRSRMVSQEYIFAGVLNLSTLATFTARPQTLRGSGRVQ
jgi:hypothetical protein